MRNAGCFITKDDQGKEQIWVRLNKKQSAALLEYFEKTEKKEEKATIKLTIAQKFRIARIIGLGMTGTTKIKSVVEVEAAPSACEKCKQSYWIFPKDKAKELLVKK